MLIRQGAEHAYVELVFLVREQKIIEGLLQLGVSLEDERVTLTRRVEKERSICSINGEVVSARILQQAAQLLIDIHGQQENITLLKEKKHLEILDLYCGKTLADVK
jgi:DNA repair protein RecN (Recombination protein N)